MVLQLKGDPIQTVYKRVALLPPEIQQRMSFLL